LQTHNLFPYPKVVTKKLRPGYTGCFLSHFLLWKQCVNLQEPILIFEHDGLLIRSLPDNILDTFDTILYLDPASRIETDYENYLKQESDLYVEHYPHIVSEKVKYRSMNMTHIKGIHAYIIKPQGANMLLNSISKFGFIAADVAINQYYVSFYTTRPSYARINPFFCNKNNVKQFSHTSGVNEC
jgi:glycosyl transferase family 25